MHEWLIKAGKIQVGAGTLRTFLAVYRSLDFFPQKVSEMFSADLVLEWTLMMGQRQD